MAKYQISIPQEITDIINNYNTGWGLVGVSSSMAIIVLHGGAMMATQAKRLAIAVCWSRRFFGWYQNTIHDNYRLIAPFPWRASTCIGCRRQRPQRSLYV